MSSNNTTLNTIIDQVEWIESISSDFIVTMKDHKNELTAQGEKTFGNLDVIAAAIYRKCETLPFLITMVVFLIVTGIVMVISLLFVFAKCIYKIVYHHYVEVRKLEEIDKK